ncbi:MAG: hypothetical protein FJZ01_14915, partial [Candidatus Sericytochromatia bacterium]|nr:hypothetical protein [Candidatus Tanganyikabacteria bacterium]
AAAAARRLREEAQVAAVRKEAAALRADLAKVESSLVPHLQALDLAGQATLQDLEEAEALLAAQREKLSQHDRLRERLAAAEKAQEQGARQAERAAKAAADAVAREEEELARWAAWKLERHLPETLGPRGALDFFEAVKDARAALRARDEARASVARLGGEVAAYDARCREALVLAGREALVPADGEALVPADAEALVLADGETLVPADGEALVPADGEALVPADGEALVPADGETLVPADGVADGPGEATRTGEAAPDRGDSPGAASWDLLARVEAQRSAISEDAAARKESSDLAARLVALDKAVADAEEACRDAQGVLAATLAEAGAADSPDYRRRLDVFLRRKALGEGVANLDLRIASRIGTDASAEALRAELATGAFVEWQGRVAAAAGVVKAALEAWDEKVREHENAKQELEALERSSDVAAISLDREAIASRLASAIDEYRVVALAEGLVRATLERYERERQPAVLAHAGRLFEQVTGGQYLELLQKRDDLLVRDRNGGYHRPHQLSTGTAQELYVCLRLALAADLGDRAVELPIVMDDVLVNFDPERAPEMARLIGQHAAGSQGLAFTCHPAHADLLAAACPGARRIKLERYGGADGPVALPLEASTARAAAVPESARSSPAGSPSMDLATAIQAIRDLLAAESRSLLKREIVAHVGGDEAACSRALDALRQEGIVTTEGAGRGLRYRLAPPPVEGDRIPAGAGAKAGAIV